MRPVGALRVLIAEDEIAVARLLQVIMERRGFQASIVSDGALALKQVKEAPPDLILLDLVMPVMTGYEFLAQIRSDPTTANIPVVVVSTEENIRNLTEPCVECVSKPFDLFSLEAAVDRALQSCQQDSC